MPTRGRYRIQSVAEMTGVSAATLRAWERRYGVPTPRRSHAAYRLYSDQDVAIIRRVRELCDAGMAPSEAARNVLAASDDLIEAALIETDTDDLAVQRIVDAVERFDPGRLDAVVRSTLFLGPAATLVTRIYGPALAQVGERWAEGSFNVAHEHLASEIIGDALRFLLRLVTPERPRGRVVLACLAAEDHASPLYGVALRLASWGWRPVLLGARTPPAAIARAVDELRPDVVGLSVTMALPDPGPLLAEYAAACAKTPWLVGGRGSAGLGEALAASGGHLAPDTDDRLHALIHTLARAGARVPDL